LIVFLDQLTPPEHLKLIPPFELTLERALGVMGDDEYLEITPKDVRLRKQFLTEAERKKNK
jgi:GTP-binding protein